MRNFSLQGSLPPVAVVCLLVAFQCRPVSSPDDPVTVTNLRFTPSAFDSFKRNAEMKYTLSSPASVSLYIVKRDSSRHELLVKTLARGLAETKGSHSVTWIGDTDGHYFAPVGIYLGLIRIGSERFETVVEVFHY